MSPTVGASRSALLVAWWVVLASVLVTVGALGLWLARPGAQPGSAAADGAGFAAQVRGSAVTFARTAAALEMRRALRQRARAVRRHDHSGFLGAVVPTAQRAQATVYRRLTAVPFDRYEFSDDVVPPGVGTLATGRAAVPVHLRSRLEGEGVVSRDRAVARFRFEGGRWRLLGVAPRHPAIWDLARVDVVRSARSLVLAAPGTTTAVDLAAEVDQAVAAVDDVWPLRWPGRVVVVLPRTPAQLTRLVGEPGSASLAGVTSFHGFDSGSVVRVQLNPALFAGLVPLAEQILLRHEITHAAQYARTDDQVPVWLAEGTAEYVGYLGSGVPARVVAPSVLADAAAGRVPAGLPTAGDFAFTGGATGRRVAYERAWTACQMVADRYGQRALFALYRAVGDGHGTAVERQRAAVRAVLHVPYRTFVQQWQIWLRSRA